MKLYTQEQIEDKHIGKKGTPRRDRYEAQFAEELRQYYLGESLKDARKAKRLSQEELGELLGVKKAQVCKMESGVGVRIETFLKAFRAMKIPVKLDLGKFGTIKVA